jgi:hypothetical protein
MRTPIHAAHGAGATGMQCGAVAEWSKALAWKVSMGQKPIEGSNPSRSAIYSSEGIPPRPESLRFPQLLRTMASTGVRRGPVQASTVRGHFGGTEN